MTVSPQRAPDGNPQPATEGRAVALPPTLFQLPNLKAASQESPPAGPESDVPAHPPTAFPTPVETEAPATCQAIPAIPSGTGVEPVNANTDSSQPDRTAPPSHATNGHSTNPTAKTEPNPAPTAPPSNPSTSAHPAGRAWMETIGSHGIVILLLLVVVAAALITGRNTQEQDASLSEHTELLDFGAGADVDLPLPKHGFDEPAQYISSADVHADPATPDSVGLENTMSSFDSAASSVADMTFPSEAAVTEPAPPAAAEVGVDTDNAVVLSEPQSASEQVLSQAVDDVAGTSRVRINQFMSESTSVNAAPASTRDSVTGDSTLPSLEDLAIDADSATSTHSDAHRLSKTPNGVANWSRYLPQFAPATAPTAQDNSSSQ